MTGGDLRKRIKACPKGHSGWHEWEQCCTDALRFLFVPPLEMPRIQPRTYSGTDRRDAVFPNRNMDINTNWGRLQKELNARMVLFEFKNYDGNPLGKDEVNQTRSYLTTTIGRLAIIVASEEPDRSAHIKRNTVFSEEKKVILFLSKDQMIEMILMKERGEDPSNLIMDLVEEFYLKYE